MVAISITEFGPDSCFDLRGSMGRETSWGQMNGLIFLKVGTPDECPEDIRRIFLGRIDLARSMSRPQILCRPTYENCFSEAVMTAVNLTSIT